MKYVEVNLPVGQLVAIVDDEDFERVDRWSWCGDKNWYAKAGTTIGGRSPQKKSVSFSMHRFILGVTDPKIQVHHFDNDPLNNQKSNLVPTNSVGNARGRRKKSLESSSTFRGVRWDEQAGVWRATLNLGSFATEQEAAAEWNRVAKFAWGDKGQLNNLSSEQSVDMGEGGKGGHPTANRVSV